MMHREIAPDGVIKTSEFNQGRDFAAMVIDDSLKPCGLLAYLRRMTEKTRRNHRRSSAASLVVFAIGRTKLVLADSTGIVRITLAGFGCTISTIRQGTSGQFSNGWCMATS
jgi:hypothetical protein